MNIEKKADLGLSTAEALKRLHDDIKKVLENYKDLNFKQNNENILSIYSIIITILVILGLFYTSYYFTALLVLFILILNAFFARREEKLKKTEMFRKAENLLEDIELSITLSKDWKSINYPHLCSPLSPCISLCWTYRDKY
jgi:hypothetical protein